MPRYILSLASCRGLVRGFLEGLLTSRNSSLAAGEIVHPVRSPDQGASEITESANTAFVFSKPLDVSLPPKNEPALAGGGRASRSVRFGRG